MIDTGYVAGLFDGEGSIGIYRIGYIQANRKRGLQLKIVISLTNEEPLILLKSEWGGNIQFDQHQSKKNPKHRPSFVWNLHQGQAGKFLEDIFPYLIIKRTQAKVAFSFLRTIRSNNDKRRRITDSEDEFRETLAVLLKKLKHR